MSKIQKIFEHAQKSQLYGYIFAISDMSKIQKIFEHAQKSQLYGYIFAISDISMSVARTFLGS